MIGHDYLVSTQSNEGRNMAKLITTAIISAALTVAAIRCANSAEVIRTRVGVVSIDARIASNLR